MTIKLVTTTLGPLTVRVVDDDARVGPPALVVVLCHGYGAPGSDLVGLAGEVLAQQPTLAGRVRFVFPEAPLDVATGAPPQGRGSGGRMWWPIDMLHIQELAARGVLTREPPKELAPARKALLAMLDVLQTSTGLPMSKIVLGGFSQGAMLTTDVALRLDEAPAGLCILSGALMGEDEWTKAAPKRKGLPVLQSHGTRDPILPFKGAEKLRDLLTTAGLGVKFVSFVGGHGIDGDVVDDLAAFIVARANT